MRAQPEEVVRLYIVRASGGNLLDSFVTEANKEAILEENQSRKRRRDEQTQVVELSTLLAMNAVDLDEAELRFMENSQRRRSAVTGEDDDHQMIEIWINFKLF
jgi:hypothetical protein